MYIICHLCDHLRVIDSFALEINNYYFNDDGWILMKQFSNHYYRVNEQSDHSLLLKTVSSYVIIILIYE